MRGQCTPWHQPIKKDHNHRYEKHAHNERRASMQKMLHTYIRQTLKMSQQVRPVANASLASVVKLNAQFVFVGSAYLALPRRSPPAQRPRARTHSSSRKGSRSGSTPPTPAVGTRSSPGRTRSGRKNWAPGAGGARGEGKGPFSRADSTGPCMSKTNNKAHRIVCGSCSRFCSHSFTSRERCATNLHTYVRQIFSANSSTPMHAIPWLSCDLCFLPHCLYICKS